MRGPSSRRTTDRSSRPEAATSGSGCPGLWLRSSPAGWRWARGRAHASRRSRSPTGAATASGPTPSRCSHLSCPAAGHVRSGEPGHRRPRARPPRGLPARRQPRRVGTPGHQPPPRSQPGRGPLRADLPARVLERPDRGARLPAVGDRLRGTRVWGEPPAARRVRRGGRVRRPDARGPRGRGGARHTGRRRPSEGTARGWRPAPDREVLVLDRRPSRREGGGAGHDAGWPRRDRRARCGRGQSRREGRAPRGAVRPDRHRRSTLDGVRTDGARPEREISPLRLVPEAGGRDRHLLLPPGEDAGAAVPPSRPQRRRGQQRRPPPQTSPPSPAATRSSSHRRTT